VSIRGRHPRYSSDSASEREAMAYLTRNLQPGDNGYALKGMTVGGMLQSNAKADRDALSRSMAHYPQYGPPDPKWNSVKPNFEGVAMNEDPDAHDRVKDRRLAGEIP